MYNRFKKAVAVLAAVALMISMVPAEVVWAGKGPLPSPDEVKLDSATVALTSTIYAYGSYPDSSNIATIAINGYDPTSNWTRYVDVVWPSYMPTSQGEHTVTVTVKGKSPKVVVSGSRNVDVTYWVDAPYVPPTPQEQTDFKLGSSSATIKIGDSTTITYSGNKTSPVTASIKSGSEFVTLSGLAVTGKAAGTAVIDVTAPASGTSWKAATRTFTVTVGKKQNSDFAVEPASATINIKGTAKIGVKNQKGNVSYKVASGENKISLNASTGEVTGVKTGTASVTVTDDGGAEYESVDKTFTVNISKDANTDFDLNTSSASIKVGGNVTISTKNQKGKVSAKVASGADVVSLNGLQVVGKKAGTAAITVADDGGDDYEGAEKTFTVKVEKGSSTFTVSPASKTITVGESFSIASSNAKGKTAAKITSGSSVSLSGMKVTGKSAGKSVITVTDPGSDDYEGGSKTVTVNVNAAVQTVTLSPGSGSVLAGKSASIKISGIKTSKPAVTSNKPGIVVVSNVSKNGFKITGKKPGSAVVTVSVPKNNSYKAATVKLSVTVSKASAKTQKIVVTPTSVSLAKKGKTKQLKVTQNKTQLSYKSSNTKVAVVNGKGKITAKGKGTCYITVTAKGTNDYLQAVKTVKVVVKK